MALFRNCSSLQEQFEVEVTLLATILMLDMRLTGSRFKCEMKRKKNELVIPIDLENLQSYVTIPSFVDFPDLLEDDFGARHRL